MRKVTDVNIRGPRNAFNAYEDIYIQKATAIREVPGRVMNHLRSSA
jgi:hypothetical protein